MDFIWEKRHAKFHAEIQSDRIEPISMDFGFVFRSFNAGSYRLYFSWSCPVKRYATIQHVFSVVAFSFSFQFI
jgi:hypothetical protein